MTGMEIHDAIGDGMVIVLTPFAIAAALVAVFAVGVKVAAFVMYGSERKDLDVIGSHLVSADGKGWDFSKSQSAHARAQSNISAYDDPKARGSTRAAKGEEVAIGLTGLFHILSEPPGPDDEEEGGPDDIEDAVIEFDTPDYSEAAPVVKTLKPKKV